MGLRANPTYRQRRFGAEVRRLRERAGLTVSEAADVMGMRQSHVSNVEAGRTSLAPARLRELAQTASGTRSTYLEALIEMGEARGKGWWSTYRSAVRPSLLDLAELESGARRLLGYEPMFIPGLLQTREYAAAIHHGGYTREARRERDRAIEFRMRRQQVLHGNGAPQTHLIVHEAALHVSLGQRHVMRDQLIQLIEIARLPHVTVQVLPFAGPVPFGTSFTVLEPQVEELGTVVVSHVEKSLYLGDPDALARYHATFARLSEVALPPVDAAVLPESHAVKDSLGIIQRVLYPLL
ncbi:helix-turn-helix domain-containing protein [Streptomyces sp. NRRL F-5755]|uniref:helix-turn-helix domain-containing protein n=1 Tax=Streptomyces sp. NRRL F-5755 TaxID=1519475 RepID=UPI00099DAFB2|nr:helix-turn-helix transcriptional regulator [Streptomyces sp. NRRL F-5755]